MSIFSLAKVEMLELSDRGFRARITTNQGNAREFSYSFSPADSADIKAAVKDRIKQEIASLISYLDDCVQYPTGKPTGETKLDIVSTIGKTTLYSSDLGLSHGGIYRPVFGTLWNDTLPQHN